MLAGEQGLVRPLILDPAPVTMSTLLLAAIFWTDPELQWALEDGVDRGDELALGNALARPPAPPELEEAASRAASRATQRDRDAPAKGDPGRAHLERCFGSYYLVVSPRLLPLAFLARAGSAGC